MIDGSECHNINSAGRGVRVRCMQRSGAVGGRDICDCVRAEGRGGLECPVVGWILACGRVLLDAVRVKLVLKCREMTEPYVPLKCHSKCHGVDTS